MWLNFGHAFIGHKCSYDLIFVQTSSQSNKHEKNENVRIPRFADIWTQSETFAGNQVFILYIFYSILITLLKVRFQLFSIILLLFGSLVTYHQTASDSGPNFLAKLFNLKVCII